MAESVGDCHSLKDSARGVKTVGKTILALAGKIACQWQLCKPPRSDLAYLVAVLALILCDGQGAQANEPRSEGEVLIINCLEQAFGGALRQCRDSYARANRLLLETQGFTCVDESSLQAFFISHLYEALRFTTSSDYSAVTVTRAAGSRGRAKRGKGAYFSPPSLAYLAASQALDDGRDGQMPLVFDPAAGTGSFLIAALDLLSLRNPQVSRREIAERSLKGIEIDKTTCEVGRICLAKASGEKVSSERGSAQFICGDGLLNALVEGQADVVITNPPWYLVKQAGERSPVNKSRAAARRKNFDAQGHGDTNIYKLFVERCLQVTAPGARIVVLVPATFLEDSSSQALRKRLLEEGNLKEVHFFDNADSAFAIHGQFRYVLLTYQKGDHQGPITLVPGLSATTSRLLKSGKALQLEARQLQLLGGENRTVQEFESAQALLLHSRVYANTKTFGDYAQDFCGRLTLRREFDMTMDRGKMIDQARFQALASASPENRSQYFALVQGAMIEQFSCQGEPSLFLKSDDYLARCPQREVKIGFQSISSSLNKRTMIASLLPDLPVGNSLTTIRFTQSQDDTWQAHYVLGIFNSFVFDYFLRNRLSGTSITYSLLKSLPFARAEGVLGDAIANLACGLHKGHGEMTVSSLKKRVLLEVLVARAFKFTEGDLRLILQGCHLPVALLAKRRRLDASLPDILPGLRGFFRVDKTLPAEQRLTVLVLKAFTHFQDNPQRLSEEIEAAAAGVCEPGPFDQQLEEDLAARFATSGQASFAGSV